MIGTEQTIVIEAAIDDVWGYVLDISRWASLMPGYRECELIDRDHSRWTLKIGVGALVRTVKVLVHVEKWDGPSRAAFSYKLEGDPVEGSGTYFAEADGVAGTNVTLNVRVRGSGSIAPMWEAMGKPLLPKLAKSFADQLKDKIEEKYRVPAAEPEVPAEPMSTGRVRNMLRSIGASPAKE